ncbi:MAG: carboxylesterase/lipase family protein [Longimicrobiales bacterium]
MTKRHVGKRGSAVPATATMRSIDQGDVVGLQAENGASVWRGVPYAASTAGVNRWRPPRPAPRWEGVREALDFAQRCAQLTNEFDEDEGLTPGLVVGSEDCLALDIYAPADALGATLPVMVWIHGGGNVWGRSSTYDGSRLAKHENVVIVAVQYRLGPLGWFAHEALRSTARQPEDACACFATLDLIAALKWVRQNIAAFGGDPGNVTIFGESAGGHNVVTLMASPMAKGLFHRAIVQSGVFDSISLAGAECGDGGVLNPSRLIAEKLEATSAEALRGVPVDRLLGAYTRGRGFVDVPRVIQDGVVLPTTPLRDSFASTDTFNAVPLMMGTNRDEMKLFYVNDDRLTKKSFGVLRVPRDQDEWDALTGYLSRLWRISSVDLPATMMTEAGHRPVYVYRFDWDDGGRLLHMDFKKLFGATHGFEIPFVFNRFQHLGNADRFLFHRKTLEGRERLSRAMGSYWASFARQGLPSCMGAPEWPVYGELGGSFLRLDASSDRGIEVLRGPDSVDSIVADLNNDTRVDRCFVVDELDKWMFTRPFATRLRVATGCESAEVNGVCDGE